MCNPNSTASDPDTNGDTRSIHGKQADQANLKAADYP
jgi:hypothetical protein